MNVRVGDTVEVIHHMSNRGEVKRVYYKSVTAGTGPGTFSKATWVIFESAMDGKTYNMKLQDLRVVRD